MGKPPFKKGDEIGSYIIEGIFSMGGMGVVYRVKNDQVLIKSPFADSDPEILEQFQEEVGALKKLDHPGIVKILATGIHNNIPWYAMQKLEGETLRERLRRECKLLCTEALRIEYQIVQSMAYAHSRDKPVWHRDLKPDNIRFQGKRPVILDFGLARFGTDSSAILSPHGTLLYMAPEQIRGHADGRTDVYALGVILYEMLHGTTPFAPGRDEHDSALIERILDPEIPCPKLPAEIDERIASIAEKALNKRPEFRYADATEMVADIKFALRTRLKKDAIALEQNKDYRAAAELLREAVEYGLSMIELEEFWKFRLGKSLKVVLIDHASIEPAKKALELKNHPYLIPILEVIEGDLPYLVVESLTSDPLTRRFSEANYLSFNECVALCRAIRQSLESVKEQDLLLLLEERRIFPGERFRIGGLHRARLGYREIPAQHLAQILVRALSGAATPNWKDFPDLFREVLQTAKEGKYEGDAIALAKEVEDIWNDQDEHLLEIEKLKKSLRETPASLNPELVDRLVSLFLGDYRQTIRDSARQALEEVFGTDASKARDPVEDAKRSAGITEKIAAFLRTLFQADPLEEPAPSLSGKPETAYADFIAFLENAIQHPSDLSLKKARQLFGEFLRHKTSEAKELLEQERLQFKKAGMEKDRLIAALEKQVARMQAVIAEREEMLIRQEEMIGDLKMRPPTPTALDKISKSIGESLALKQGEGRSSIKVPRELWQAIRDQVLWHLTVLLSSAEQILYHLLGERSSLTGKEREIERKVQEVLTKAAELKIKVESTQYTPASENLEKLLSYTVIAEYMRQRFFELVRREQITQQYGAIHIILPG